MSDAADDPELDTSVGGSTLISRTLITDTLEAGLAALDDEDVPDEARAGGSYIAERLSERFHLDALGEDRQRTSTPASNGTGEGVHPTDIPRPSEQELLLEAVRLSRGRSTLEFAQRPGRWRYVCCLPGDEWMGAVVTPVDTDTDANATADPSPDESRVECQSTDREAVHAVLRRGAKVSIRETAETALVRAQCVPNHLVTTEDSPMDEPALDGGERREQPATSEAQQEAPERGVTDGGNCDSDEGGGFGGFWW